MALIVGDPTDLTFQVRLLIGDVSQDTNEQFFEDAFIDHYLTTNANNVRKTAIQLLQFAINFLSTDSVDHIVGGVEIKASQLLKQKQDLLTKLLTDPAYITGTLGIIVGGTSKSKSQAYRDDTDFQGSPIYLGYYTGED